jgi:signal transduction histidine kinase
VRGNREDTAQVVLAVLDNARIHAPSQIDVSVRSLGVFTTLSVEDRGPGIPPTARRAMFKRGRRSAQSPGSGLGLFIAERLMIDQGGSLIAAPRTGGGTSITLQLPTATSCSAEEHPQVVAHPAVVR